MPFKFLFRLQCCKRSLWVHKQLLHRKAHEKSHQDGRISIVSDGKPHRSSMCKWPPCASQGPRTEELHIQGVCCLNVHTRSRVDVLFSVCRSPPPLSAGKTHDTSRAWKKSRKSSIWTNALGEFPLRKWHHWPRGCKAQFQLHLETQTIQHDSQGSKQARLCH